MKRILCGLIRGYQWTFGLVLPSACRFYPSCSEYAASALKTHSLHYGVWLILKRLLKCHPFCQGGLDPVPSRRKS